MNKLSILLIKAFAVFQLCLPIINITAQTSANAINYQAVVRNSGGNVEPDQSIAVQFTILAGDVNGTVVWKEEHSTQTNRFGLFTLNIGKGSRKEGVAQFSDISWGANKHFLKVEVKIGDNKDYAFYGTTQMLAVPYALYADKAGTATPDFTKFTFDVNANTLKNDGVAIADLSPLRQDLQYDPTSYHLSITGKPGIIDLRQFAHSPQDLRFLNNKLWVTGNKDSTVVDLSTYKQTLSVSAASKLQISGGNEVQMDTSNVNEIQKISRSDSKIILSRNGGEVSVDTSSVNEIQKIVRSESKIILSHNGGEVSVDTSNVNEIQTLSLNGNKVGLSKSGGEVTIDASETNELQDLLIANNKISLSKSVARAVPIDTNTTNELIISTSFDGEKIHILEGGNDNQIDVSALKNVSWVGFNCQKNSEVTISKQTTVPGLYDIQWDQVDNLNSTSTFESATKFIVPSSGVYQISFSLMFDNPISVQIIRGSNEVLREYPAYFFGEFLSTQLNLSLSQGDRISIRLINPTINNCIIRKGDFTGNRIH